jgi:intergrase/recombinase
MIALDDYAALKRKIESLKRDKDKAEGALEQILEQMKTEFEVNSIEEAKEMLASLQAKELSVMNKYVKAKKEFEKKWKDVLDELDD